MEMGSRLRLGARPDSARAGREWNLPSRPDVVLKLRRVFTVLMGRVGEMRRGEMIQFYHNAVSARHQAQDAFSA